MSRLYSKRLLVGGALDSASATVPAGVVWVVRDSLLYFDGASTSDGYALEVNIAGGGLGVIQRGIATATQQEIFAWQGRQVLNAGDELVFGASTLNWYIMVSGYELTLP